MANGAAFPRALVRAHFLAEFQVEASADFRLGEILQPLEPAGALVPFAFLDHDRGNDFPMIVVLEFEITGETLLRISIVLDPVLGVVVGVKVRAIRLVNAMPNVRPLLPRKMLAPTARCAAVMRLRAEKDLEEIVTVPHVGQ